MAADTSGCSQWDWAARWFGDTVCEPRDKIGFVIGLISVVLWALAEVPQLLVNAIEGSSEGLSEGLLWLWVFSDVLDVVGCTISDTLPTMLITAWMYFIFTLLLLCQHVYYSHCGLQAEQDRKIASEESQPLLTYDGDDDLVADLRWHSAPQYRHRHPYGGGAGMHTVYGSLRNLSIRRTSSSSSLSFTDTGRRLQSSFAHRLHRRRCLAPAVLAGPDRPPTADAATIRSLRTASLPRSFLGTPAAGKMLAGAALLVVAGLTPSAAGSVDSSSLGEGQLGDSNLHVDGNFLGISTATWGAIMGWTMAVTFFLGRVPQVIKNCRRQSCAGLSVEMFLVVFSAAVTYCASILIRVRSWADLAPKLPFFTDAAVGALLDLVILAQFLMYKSTDDDPATADSEAAGNTEKEESNSRPASGRPHTSGRGSGAGTSAALPEVTDEKLAALNRLETGSAADTLSMHDGNLALLQVVWVQVWVQVYGMKEFLTM